MVYAQPTSQKQYSTVQYSTVQYSTVQYSTAHLTEAGAAVHNLQTQTGVGKAASEDLRSRWVLPSSVF